MSADQTFVELFAGIGLVRLGLERAGWHCIFANDIDPDKAAIYQANFPGSNFLCGDIRNVTVTSISTRPTLVTASFPCQDLSLAGSGAGLNGSRSGTFWDFIRLVRVLADDGRKPILLLIENVPGLLTSNKGRDFPAVIRSLNNLDYACDSFVIDALHFLPHSRARLFILAVEKEFRGAAENNTPWSVFGKHLLFQTSDIRPQRLVRAIRSHRELDWVLLDVPRLPPIRRQTLSSLLEPVKAVETRFWFSPKKVEKLLQQMKPKHLAAVLAAKNCKQISAFPLYRRTREDGTRAEVRFDAVAGCLRTPVGGSSKQFLILSGNGKIRGRVLTPREYARLQGTPEDFQLSENDNQNYWGFGDAVAVPVIQWIAKEILNPIVRKLNRVERPGKMVESTAAR